MAPNITIVIKPCMYQMIKTTYIGWNCAEYLWISWQCCPRYLPVNLLLWRPVLSNITKAKIICWYSSKRRIKISYCKWLFAIFIYAFNPDKTDFFTRVKGNRLLTHWLWKPFIFPNVKYLSIGKVLSWLVTRAAALLWDSGTFLHADRMVSYRDTFHSTTFLQLYIRQCWEIFWVFTFFNYMMMQKITLILIQVPNSNSLHL